MNRLTFRVGIIVLLGIQGCGGSVPAGEAPPAVSIPSPSADTPGDTTTSAAKPAPATERPFYCYETEFEGEKPAGCEPTLEQCKASLAEWTGQGATVVDACEGVAKAHCLQYRDEDGFVWVCRKTEDDCIAATTRVNEIFVAGGNCGPYTKHPEAPEAAVPSPR